MKIKAIVMAIIFSFFAFKSHASVTLCFADAIDGASKVALVTIKKSNNKRLIVNITRCFKGAFNQKIIRIESVKDFTLNEFVVGSKYFILLNSDNTPYKTNFGCGELDSIEMKNNKVRQGIFRYAAGSYEINDPEFQTTEQISNAIKKSIQNTAASKGLGLQAMEGKPYLLYCFVGIIVLCALWYARRRMIMRSLTHSK